MNNYFTLNHAVAFYVPSTKNQSETISESELKNRTELIASQLTGWFGGASIERVQGFYKLDNGSYVTEVINKVVAFTSDNDLEAHSQELLNLAHAKVAEWSQETIGVEIDSKFILVD